MAKKTVKPNEAWLDDPAPDLPVDDASLAEVAPIGAEVAAETPPVDPNWRPGSCINCGTTDTASIHVDGYGHFHCARCQHVWSYTDEQAPFRRLARR